MSLKKPLIVVNHPIGITKESREKMRDAITASAEAIGADVLIVPHDFNIEVHDNSLHDSINNMAQRITDLVESNDRLTKALIESYSEAEPDYDTPIPQPVYMDGSEVK